MNDTGGFEPSDENAYLDVADTYWLSDNTATDHSDGRWEALTVSNSGSTLKFMPPGHFCPDVCGLEDFGEADYLRGRVVRGFFRLMRLWPVPRG